jgi:hypothetical protein
MQTGRRKLFMVLSIIFFCLLTVQCVAAAETQETECHYEVTQVFENSVMVSETKVRKCKEETKDSNKFDPKHNFKDYVKVQLVDVGLLGVIIALAK